MLRYYLNGKQRKRSLGRVDEMTLEQARKKAVKSRQHVREGQASATINSSSTVAEVADDYFKLKELEARQNQFKSLTEYRIANDKCIGPKLGHMQMVDVRRRDVIEALQDLTGSSHGRTLCVMRGISKVLLDKEIISELPTDYISAGQSLKRASETQDTAPLDCLQAHARVRWPGSDGTTLTSTQ